MSKADEIKELTEKHLEVMCLVRGGATIFGLEEATLLREVEKYNKKLINIIDNMEKLEKIAGDAKDLYDNRNPKTGHLAYFGAILTYEGKKWLKKECYNRGLDFI